jgi:protein-disulfide isomerase
MSKKSTAPSKRQAIREQRQKKQRQQRTITILGIGLVAVVFAALLIVPGIQRATAPVGTVIPITPRDLPQVDGVHMGDPNAPVKLDVYEDFQCPRCKDFSEQIEPSLVANDISTGKVYYTFKEFPFIDNSVPTQESHQAANASMCAADQNRFWDYHDMLFANWNGENQNNFSDKRLVAFAEQLGLDMTKFNSCFNNNSFRDQINADLAEGQSIGVTGTPSVFVNGTEVAPGFVPSYDQIQQAINDALSANGG